MKCNKRIIELQRSLRIARTALERIKAGHRNAEIVAAGALDEIWKLEPKQQLQGVVGHEPKKRRPLLIDTKPPSRTKAAKSNKEFWTRGL